MVYCFQVKTMIKRGWWLRAIETRWRRRSVLWLRGVRRVGKTCLCQSLPQSEYFDCELPRVRRQLADPESFLAGLRGKRIILDEIHRLPNPAELLKIAADHYPTVKIVATGSSTLNATVKFSDSLAGRKTDLWLTPIRAAEAAAFGCRAADQRFRRGGLPAFIRGRIPTENDFQDWMEAYWARDITELFRLESRSSLLRFAELLLANSGGIFEAVRYARPCEVSRTTIANYLRVLEETLLALVVRPFSTHRATEIVAAPKIYGFDTGFVCHFRNWTELRQDDYGILWEHLVLNELLAELQSPSVRYWRNKHGHEIDFVLAANAAEPTAIECKWSADGFAPRNLKSFRTQYPRGRNWVVASDVDRPFTRNYDTLTVEFTGLAGLPGLIAGSGKKQ